MNDTTNNDDVPAEVAGWIRAIVGEYKLAGNYRRHNERTGVWGIQAAGGMRFLKIHKEKRKWHPEVYAYENWASGYEPYLPKLIAVYEGIVAQGILVSSIEGTPLGEVDLPKKQVFKAYETAGRLARQVNSLAPGSFFGLPRRNGEPQTDAPADPVEYMKLDLHKWANLDKAVKLGGITAEELKLLRWAHDSITAFTGEPAIPINNDYTPGNWLVNARGEFAGVIDLECMQWGLEVDSFAMLWHKYFPGHPEAEKAFFAGYGIDVPKEKPVQARVIQVKIAMANITWGIEHNEPNRVILGRENLRRLTASGGTR